eukprot:6123525-Amphidinium_carterae.2
MAKVLEQLQGIPHAECTGEVHQAAKLNVFVLNFSNLDSPRSAHLALLDLLLRLQSRDWWQMRSAVSIVWQSGKYDSLTPWRHDEQYPS